MKLHCDRCQKEFEKSNEPHSRIRKVVDMSVGAMYDDGRVNHTYYLCPKCATAFNQWMHKFYYKKKEDYTK